MAEYYTVLKKAIGGLDSNQADARRTVYDKARNALIGQLKAVDPPQVCNTPLSAGGVKLVLWIGPRTTT